MCRHLAYLGPPRTVSEILTSGAHSLVRQSWEPSDMRDGGTINVEGFGVSWWTDGTRRSYRNAVPIWSDPAVEDVLSSISSTAVLGAVRSATDPDTVHRAASAPFGDDSFGLSLNGRIIDWRNVFAPLLRDVPIADILTMPAMTDAGALWVLLRHRLSRGVESALESTVADLLGSEDPRLTVLLCNGTDIWATAVHHSLWTRSTVDADGRAAVWVASEPIDGDEAWRPVPDRSLVHAQPGRIDIRPLTSAGTNHMYSNT